MLLQTKFYIPPARPGLVARRHLVERLNQGLRLGHKLTLVSAPAGFGKSTLVGEWVVGLRQDAARESDRANRIAWLSLDEGDRDPKRFLAYVVAALNQTAEIPVGKGALGMLQSPQPPAVESVLTSLVNDLTALPGSMMLVLDDYHLVDSPPVDKALAFLLEHLPAQMHLVIATRIDPNLPLARLRARGQLAELRASDLRFSSSEAALFLNRMMGLALPAEAIATLESRTEGWIAGLQLAALSLQGRQDSADLIQSFSGSHRFVLDYLIEEVLEQQPAAVQSFLLNTTILDKLTGPLCDALRFGETPSSSAGTAVSAEHDGQATLEMLERANLFLVPLDDDRCWYRYHHLFADLLRQRLLQTQPEGVPTLHRRASEWYEQNGYVDEAIEHALRGEYFQRAASLIADQNGANYERLDQAVLQRWLAELPQEVVLSRPRLIVLRAWILFNSGQLAAAGHDLQTAAELLSYEPDREPVLAAAGDQLPEMDRKAVVGRIAIMRSFIASFAGDTPTVIQYARQALEILPQQELTWRSAAYLTMGDAYAGIGQMEAARAARSEALVTGQASGDPYYLTIVYLSLAETLRQQGRLREVIDICRRRLRIAEESGFAESELIGWLLGIWGEALAELNDLDHAVDLAQQGAKLAARGLDVLYVLYSNLYLVRVLFTSGKLSEAQEIIASLAKPVRAYDIPIWGLRSLAAWQARVWLAQGQIEQASRWVEEQQLHPDTELAYEHEMTHIVLARVLIAQGRLHEADGLLQRLLQAAKAGGRTASVIELLILLALAAQAAGDTSRALSALEQALLTAQAEGFIRIFVHEGPPLARLLYQALAHEISPEYVRQLLAAFPAPQPQQAEISRPPDADAVWVEPLSAREIEVLQLIAEGLKNREISARLYLSQNTVKVHNRNIFGKLGVNSRTQAVARARALGILKQS